MKREHAVRLNYSEEGWQSSRRLEEGTGERCCSDDVLQAEDEEKKSRPRASAEGGLSQLWKAFRQTGYQYHPPPGL